MTSTTNNSTNDVDPTSAPKIQKPKSGVRKPWEVIYNGLTPMETKLHILLVALKALMLKIPVVIIKK